MCSHFEVSVTKISSVIVIFWLMLSLWALPKVITLCGYYCTNLIFDAAHSSLGSNANVIPSVLTNYIYSSIVNIFLIFESTVKFVYNDHPQGPKLVAVVGRWTLFRVLKLKTGTPK
jgi:hypothetical protein